MAPRRRPPSTPSGIPAAELDVPASAASVVGGRAFGALVAGFAVGVGAVALIRWAELRAAPAVVDGISLQRAADGGTTR